jgi:hypothetical protein
MNSPTVTSVLSELGAFLLRDQSRTKFGMPADNAAFRWTTVHSGTEDSALPAHDVGTPDRAE